MIKPWKRASTQTLADYRIFRVRSDVKVSPISGREHDFYVIDCVNWVNVIARTPQDELVMIEQYRHGSETVELEAPGGMIDPEDASPVAAAVRELREETGYEGKSARIIGEVFPNPAIMSNVCYTVFIDDCRPAGPVDFDATEDLLTRLVPATEAGALVRAGKIRHSLVTAALFHYDLLRRG
ncbi:MAG TPA: NUDIX hydrolase [Verrucomicrobiae bacterium]|jgi:8-oxo-dGTP pyrophosphatase MutT (NUDIX family)|nr:NUDIX hydrolase [Verrucomicrobiae bacterium]